ncbi:MAG: hypothetical protein WCN95_12475, partial [bacterium]
YYPCQHGTASMKAVLPALTGKTYENLAIHEGGQASSEFMRVTFGKVPDADRQQVLRNLEEYCGQDTLGMLDILQRLAVITSPQELLQHSRRAGHIVKELKTGMGTANHVSL